MATPAAERPSALRLIANYAQQATEAEGFGFGDVLSVIRDAFPLTSLMSQTPKGRDDALLLGFHAMLGATDEVVDKMEMGKLGEGAGTGTAVITPASSPSPGRKRARRSTEVEKLPAA